MVIEHDGCKGCAYDLADENDFPCRLCFGTADVESGYGVFEGRQDMYMPKGNSVDHPGHYNHGDVECIDALRSALGAEGFLAFCKGNVIKYLWRCDFKGETEDIEKAKWYLDKYLEEVKKI